MQIYNFYSVNFAAKKNITKPITAKTKTSALPISNAKEDFYNDIEKFIKKEVSKKQYLQLFIDKMNNELYSQLNNTEKKYVYDMLTTIDLSYNKNISDAHLTERMKQLLDSRK